MKILHTSDWHLGHELYGYDREEEHTAFLEQLREIVKEEQPDVMVVSGDIYHNAAPSNTVMRMFTEYLDRIRSACPYMQVIVTAGNHDSPSRLEVTQAIWGHLDVHIIGHIAKNDGMVDFSQHVIPIKDKGMKVCGYVAALPHIFPQAYPQMDPEAPREERQKIFFRELDRYLKLNVPQDLPIVLSAHLAVSGSDITGHDGTCGGMDYTALEDLGACPDYVALGHIHCPQNLPGGRARYCGSPVPVSFDEQYVHSVSIVEVGSRGDAPRIRTVPINNPWPLKTIPGDAIPFDEAICQLKAYPREEQAYIRLNVKLGDAPPHNAFERACQSVSGKRCRFCCFKWEKQERNTNRSASFQDVEQMKARSPIEIADLYYQSRFGSPLTQEYKDMLEKVISDMEQEHE